MTTSGGTLSLVSLRQIQHVFLLASLFWTRYTNKTDSVSGLDIFSKTRVVFDNVAIAISKLQAATSTAIPNVSFGCLQSASSYQHGVAIQP
jgi:hypothetical protein